MADRAAASAAIGPVRRSFSEGGNPQSAIRNLESSSTFAQRMIRSELPPGQSALVNTDKKIELELPSSGVLASFQIERAGQQVRIVDADGSDYEGRVVNPEQLEKLQAADLVERLAAKDAAVPPGAANAPQQNAYFGNIAAQKNGYVDAQANAGELPPKTAIYGNAAQNQAASPGTDLNKLAGTPQAGDGSGFAFQVSGLNRKLNQSVSIVGSCINVPYPQGASLADGNLSNQFQTFAGMNAALKNSTTPVRPPASQSQNILDSNAVNYKNSAQNAQNAAPAGQFWRVSGQVQIGPSNRFNLDAATVPP
jgi:hypothetical protein